MNYWIFKCNPKKYRLDARLSNPEPRISWQVTRYKKDIMPGDKAFIWRCGSDRGICAVMDIETQPKDIPELDTEIPYCVDLDTGVTCRVLGTIAYRFPCLSHKILRAVPELTNLSVFHGLQRGTNFQVTFEEGEAVMKIIMKR